MSYLLYDSYFVGNKISQRISCKMLPWPIKRITANGGSQTEGIGGSQQSVCWTKTCPGRP